MNDFMLIHGFKKGNLTGLANFDFFCWPYLGSWRLRVREITICVSLPNTPKDINSR